MKDISMDLVADFAASSTTARPANFNDLSKVELTGYILRMEKLAHNLAYRCLLEKAEADEQKFRAIRYIEVIGRTAAILGKSEFECVSHLEQYTKDLVARYDRLQDQSKAAEMMADGDIKPGDHGYDQVANECPMLAAVSSLQRRADGYHCALKLIHVTHPTFNTVGPSASDCRWNVHKIAAQAIDDPVKFADENR